MKYKPHQSRNDRNGPASKLPFEAEPPVFPQYMIPHGYLTTERETHALFYYYLLARKKYEDEEKYPLPILEGHDDPDATYPIYKQILKSVAQLYNCTPEAITKAWDVVDRQCLLLKLPLMPDGEKYRHNKVPELILSAQRKDH